MEDYRNDRREQEIVFSKSVKAGKRIYYLDVKKSRNNDLFLAITESKKKFSGDEEGAVSYEKHKIFLYKEDFDKFTEALNEMLEFINKNNEANGVRDIREFHGYRSTYGCTDGKTGQERFGLRSESSDTKDSAGKYDVDVDFEI